MRITILGSAAGGGFPQWNCNCRNCAGVRSGQVNAKARTQSSIFVQPDTGIEGVLFNASPDILEQIRSHPALQPGRALRDTAIAGVVLMDGQIDHCTGLFMLRERGAKLPLWCTDPVEEDLNQGNPVLRVLEHYCGVQRHQITLDGAWFDVPGDNIGISIHDRRSGKSAFYAPGLGEITPPVFEAMCSADAVLVDGTFWTDDEMPRLGISQKTAREIGHLPQSGAGGMIEWLARLPPTTRRLLIHINNTNPILDEDSAERATLRDAGIEVCEDKMALHL